VIRMGMVGLGKMGLSHLAMINAHPDVSVDAVCDSNGYVLGVLGKYTGLQTFTDFDDMLATAALDAIVIATPTGAHAPMVGAALDRSINVFCEKPFCLTVNDSEALTRRAAELGLVTQVGYHNRFVGTFREVKSLLEARAIGEVTHVLAEAYGPVVLRPTAGTWRSFRSEGGGCLYDYAAHPIDLVNWYLGEPAAVSGTVLNRIFSREIDDEVVSTLHYERQTTAQISVNWCDESTRRMTTRLTIWGTAGRIYADRQECHVYLRDDAKVPEGYQLGWNVSYTTELTEPAWFYLRGEEYSAQLDHFIRRVKDGAQDGVNSFASATVTDKIMAAMVADADRSPLPLSAAPPARARRRWRRSRN
jgi:predicted dehydrogenase